MSFHLIKTKFSFVDYKQSLSRVVGVLELEDCQGGREGGRKLFSWMQLSSVLVGGDGRSGYEINTVWCQ